ncbi:hypothetical protein HYC85_011555 [Camellia sinensis]|uniref:Uncharacterized protein n=1 Tax=Camellia sinensis TaxID=4442 RepID=A0A7J7H9D6_CAMSI|nr:hypothetical protein HYC85_011555 [Camellia sinensis]
MYETENVQVTVKHFENLVYIRVKGESSSVQQLIVYTESNNDRGLLMKEVKDGLRKEEEMKIEAAVGFRHVIDLLSSEQKLIVGSLPSTAEEYVSSVHKYFPYINDTKVLLNANDVLRAMMKKGSTSLSKAFAFLCPEIASSVEGSRLGLKPHVNIEFSKEEYVSVFLELKETLERNNDPSSVLHPLSKLLEGGNTRASSYEFYKEICSSSISKVLFADQAESIGIKMEDQIVGRK